MAPDAFSLSDSERCLFQLLHAQSARDAQEALRALSAEAQSSLLALSRRHGLSPTLYHHLRPWSCYLLDLPWEEWQADYFFVGAQNTLRYRELGGLLDSWQRAGVQVVLLKGAGLALSVHGNIALRPMGDIDVLVLRTQVGTARAVLAKAGYEPETGREARQGLSLEFENEMAFSSPHSDLVLELHWSLLDSPFYQQVIQEAHVWAETIPLAVDNHTARILAPEANLVYLSSHWVLHHRGGTLRWLYDIDRLVECYAGQMDWAKVGELAQRWELVIPLQVMLQLAQEAGIPFPHATIDGILRLQPSKQEKQVFAQITSPQRHVLVRFVQELRQIQGLRQRARYFLGNVFPEAAYMRERYSVPAGRPIWPYYLVRLAHGLGRAVQVGIRAGATRVPGRQRQ